jgi:hypothetical protein
MRLKQANELYNFWRHRQDTNEVPIKFQKVTGDKTVLANGLKRKRDVGSDLDGNQASASRLKLEQVGKNNITDIVKMEVDEGERFGFETRVTKGMGKDKEKRGVYERPTTMGKGRQEPKKEKEKEKEKEKGISKGTGRGNKEMVSVVSVVVPCHEQKKK